MRYKLVVFCFFLVLCPVRSAQASSHEYISVVNPVRVSSYNPNLVMSLGAQYQQVSSRNLPSTWLLSFDVFLDQPALSVLKKFNSSQEFGLFLEVTPKFASQSGVKYNEIGSWHFASSVFLSGYTQNDRKKLIDTLFEKFKSTFGYYPKSVGSWWTDSFSLAYMQAKYGIIANLTCSDQFSTDGYQIWGTYWSTPYYPSKLHSGIPANSPSNKLDIVMTQWAPRDPLPGYYDSTYSTQDYFTRPKKDIDYFTYLLNLYASAHKNKFGHISIGLEGDFTPESYKGQYSAQLSSAVNESRKYGYSFATMSEFAKWYRETFPIVSPPHEIESEMVWYNSTFYRLGYKKDPIEILDFRIYSDKTQEPYFQSQNPSKHLEINIPSIIDSVSSEEDSWKFNKNTQIQTYEDKIILIGQQDFNPPPRLINRPGISLKKQKDRLEIHFSNQPLYSGVGETSKGWSLESKHFFAQLKFPIYLLTGNGWDNFKRKDYYISQDELEALYILSTLPKGKILTPDHECLQCIWNTQIQPSAYVNNRSYVKKYSKKTVVQNNEIFTEKSREEALKKFTKLNVKYIYLVKLEGYQEQLPFSPGDLRVKLVYSNANAEIWQTVEL